VPEEQFCGPPASDQGFRPQDFLDKQPFVLSQQLPGGALALSAATSALAFLIGATYVGAEWSTRAIVALLFWEPRRLRVIATKLAVLAAAATALSVAAQALWWGTAVVLSRTLGNTGDTGGSFYGDLVAQQGRALVLTVLMGLLGFSLANLVRNTGAALGVGFVYFAIVETAVRNIRPRWQEWLLTDNALALVQKGGNRLFVFGEGFVDERGQYVDSGREIVLSNLHGALVLGAVTAALVAAGVLLFQRRDLH
jgi:ABC-type transport system involved in multi-copper enzyme maturation permease subunit